MEAFLKFSVAFLALFAVALRAEEPKLRFDHLIIMVRPGAPERRVLENAGLVVAPAVNRHDGQGTASMTTELEDGFLELMWVEPSVSVSPGMERVVEKFRQRVEWRTSGRSPFGVCLSRTRPGVDPVYPFPTWSITMPWMDQGTSMVMLTTREDLVSPSVSVHPHPTQQRASPHPNRVKRITGVRIIAPRDYRPAPGVAYARDIGVINLGSGDEWLAEVTFDQGVRKITRDLRPDLPVVIHY